MESTVLVTLPWFGDVMELTEPRRLVHVDEKVPPKPVKPWVAGRDSWGKRSPVRVILESHCVPV